MYQITGLASQDIWFVFPHRGKMKRIAFQFTPYSWVKFEWKPASSLRRWLAVCGIMFVVRTLYFLIAATNECTYSKTTFCIFNNINTGFQISKAKQPRIIKKNQLLSLNLDFGKDTVYLESFLTSSQKQASQTKKGGKGS